MDDSTYSRMVADLYERIMDATDEVDPDAIEGDVMGGRLDLKAANGSKCILTTQPGPHQIWVAGAGEGVHFGYDEASGRWLDEKNPKRELSAWVTSVVKTISGEELTL
jgi:CyaY protein